MPRLERGSNHGEPTLLLTLASRCGSVGLLFRLGGVYDDAGSLRGVRRYEGEVDPRTIPVSKTGHPVCHPSRQHLFNEPPKPTATSRRGSQSDTSAKDTGDLTGQSARPLKRGAKRMGIGLTPENASPRPTTLSKTCGRILNQLQCAPLIPVTSGAPALQPMAWG